MNFPHRISRSRLPRRTFLRGSGAVLALPLLRSMAQGEASSEERPRRLIAICNDLGFIPDHFFPKTAGPDYIDSPYTAVLKKYRKDFTVFSGLSHPECVGGHQTDKCFLTGAIHPRKPGFKNTISLDQFAANQIGSSTRFPSLSLRIGPGGGSLSYSADGVRIPSEGSPSEIYRQLFVQGSPQEVKRQVTRLKDGQSLMDSFSDRVKTLEKQVGAEDKARLDQFFTSFRELEHRLHETAEWETKPKPSVPVKEPKDVRAAEALVDRTRLILDMAKLAIETDSTRLVTIFATQQFNPKVDLPGVDLPHHALTHQQGQKDSREQLSIVETAQLKEFGRLLGALKASGEGESNLLQQTMCLLGSNMGNANSHSNANLPLILAGGGFRHGQHLNCESKGETPLSNLYLTMLQRLGVMAGEFSTASGPLKGLDVA